MTINQRVLLRLASMMWMSLFLLGPAEAGELGERDGVPCIRNSATPSEGEQTWRLHELWRLGGEEDADYLMGSIRFALADESGTIFLLDQQLAQVHLFNPDGTYVRSVGREGDGPGECRGPIGMTLLPNGGIGMMQAFPARVVVVDRYGDPGDPIDLRGSDAADGGMRLAFNVQYRGGTLAYSGHESSMGAGEDERDVLAICTPDGLEKAVLLEARHRPVDETMRWAEKERYFVHHGRWAVGPEGRVFVAPEYDRYAIHVFDDEGARERIIEREYQPRQRTEEEKAGRGVHIESNGMEMPIKNVVEDHDPCIRWFFVTEAGELWVHHSFSRADLPEGIMETFDIFDREGHYVHRVQIAGEPRAEDDILFPVSSKRLVMIRGFQGGIRITTGNSGTSAGGTGDTSTEVVCYEPEL